MQKDTGYSIVTLPSSRLFTMDIGALGSRKHHVRAMIEIDVTEARKKIRTIQKKSGKTLSFTSWTLKCIGQAVSEHKSVHALRKGKNRILVFDDVDISLVIEKDYNRALVPLPIVIRKVNEKSAQELFNEIETAKKQEVRTGKDYVLGGKQSAEPMELFALLPRWLRLIIWKILLSNPRRVKNMMGTAIVTSIGMMGKTSGWFIPYSIHPVCFGLGSIVRKPGAINNAVTIREYLSLTLLIDHDVVDGAPAARFVSRLVELMETGSGL